VKAMLMAAGVVMAAVPAMAQDLVAKVSPHDVATTMDRLESAVEAAGANVFARVDHAAGAEKVEMELRPTQLLIFGNPKLGTPAMQDAQTVGLDLPMRVLVYADGEGAVHVTYEAPEKLVAAHGLPEDAQYIEKMTEALDNLTAKAIGEE
jgi:uncharacterized protein (DUF302 family)